MGIQHALCATTVITGLLVVGAQTTAEAQQPIRIGATMAQTGNLATQGVPANNGYRLCEKHVNEKGGILGRKIEFVIYDDKSDPKLAIDLYEKLITEDKVDAVMGPYGSTHTEAVAPVTEKHKKVHVSPLAATTSIWEKGRRYIFMVLPPAELFLAGLIDIGASKASRLSPSSTKTPSSPKPQERRRRNWRRRTAWRWSFMRRTRGAPRTSRLFWRP